MRDLITRAAMACCLALTMVAGIAIVAQQPAAAIEQPEIDIDNLDMVPVRMWGVADQTPANTQTPSLDVLVWDFAQIGDRMFVGGAFLNVQESKYSDPISQPYVAAFDLTSGVWIDTWRPQLDRAVYSLEVFDGALMVGGEFESVNGEARAGLVALDPQTGAIDRSFEASVDRPWSDNRAMVRDMEVDGTSLYVVGNFSHVDGPDGSRHRLYKAARLTSHRGTIDTTWRPEVTGSSVWAVATDPGRNEVHLSGFFSAVNGDVNSGYFHTVDGTTGATVTGKIDLPRNYPRSQPEIFDVAMGDGLIFTSGEQHVMQVLKPSDHEMVAFAHTGVVNDGFEYTGGFAGGAYQVAERIGNIVFAGCHCTYSERNGWVNHYSSITANRTPHRLVMAYEADTGRLIENFMADIHSPRDGTWAVASDTNGCLYIGGDFHVGGVDHALSRWVGGFAKLCEHGFDPDAQPEPEPDGDVVLAAGSTWRYDDTGADHGSAWRHPGFDDAGWATGDAEFGFGEKNQATTWTSGHVTYYARTSFEMAAGEPDALELKLKADDGAIVYLNGVEVLRDNLPDGTITASTPASDWKGGADENFATHLIPADALVAGTNLVAVEVHNVWAKNNDLSFDLEISVSDEAAPEPPPADLIALGSTWHHTDSADGEPAGWEAGLEGFASGPAELGFGDGGEATELVKGQEAYYFTHAFEVDDPADDGADLALDLMVDDGAVVYLNGTEVLRVNMPDGPIEWNTRPIDWVNGKGEALQAYTISADALVAGTNVMAVEVHNYWPGNNDLSFDLALR